MPKKLMGRFMRTISACICNPRSIEWKRICSSKANEIFKSKAYINLSNLGSSVDLIELIAVYM